MRVALFLILLITLFLNSNEIWADDPVSPEIVSSSQSLEKYCLMVRGFEEKLRKASNAERPQTAKVCLMELEAAPIPRDALGSDFFDFYKAWLQILIGQKGDGRKTLISLAGSKTMVPEVISQLMELAAVSGYSQQDRKQYAIMLGKLLPSTTWGEWTINSKVYGLADRAVFPIFSSLRDTEVGDLEHIANLFYKNQMYGHAANLYRESIYTRFARVTVIGRNYVDNFSWVSAYAAPLWIKVADAEWQQAHVREMADACAIAFVFGDEKTKNEALGRIIQIRQIKPPTQFTPFPDSDTLKQIASIYIKVRMHPRAIQLMKQYGEVIGPEAKDLQKQYETEWLKLVASRCWGTEGDCFVFAQDLLPEEKRLNAVIPYPASPQAVAEAAQIVRELEGKEPPAGLGAN